MQTEYDVQLVFTLLFLVVAFSLVRKSRSDTRAATLPPRQRIRPVLLEMLDPLLAIIVVGPVLAHELNVDAWHVLAGLVGMLTGVPIGLLRSRVQYVRAIKSAKSVVLVRSRAEYALIFLLVILRSSESSIQQNHSTSLTLLFALLLALPIGESCARTLSMVKKYRTKLSILRRWNCRSSDEGSRVRYCEQPRASTSTTPRTTSPRTIQMTSYLSTVGSQCGGTSTSRSPRRKGSWSPRVTSPCSSPKNW